MKISHKVPILTSTIILLAFTILAAVQYNMVYRTLYETLEYDSSEFSKSVADEIGKWFHGKLALIDMTAEYIAQEYSMEQIQTVMNNPVLSDEFELIFGCLQTDGKPISNTPSWFPGATWDGRKRDWYSQARAELQAILTPPYADSATGNILISVVANIKDGTKFKGAFGGDLSLKTVLKTLNSVNFNKRGYAFLVDKEGTVISYPDNTLNGKKMQEIFPLETPEVRTDLIKMKVQDRVLLVKFSPVHNLRGANWFVGIVLEEKEAMAQANNLRRITAIVAITSAILASLVLYLTMANLVLSPIKNLTDIADKISLGNLNTKIKETVRKDEIGDLAKAIERMGVSIKMAIEKLQKK